MVKVSFEERNAILQGEISNPPKGNGGNGDKTPKGNGGNVDYPPPSPPYSLLLPFQGHLQILQRNMVKLL